MELIEIMNTTAVEVFQLYPRTKQKLWPEIFWSDGCFASAVEKPRDEGMIASYIKNQEKEYLMPCYDERVVIF